MTDYFLQLTQSFNGTFGYLVLCACACIENLVPPIPGDTVTVFGGYLAGTGKLNFFGVVASTTLGNFAGFMMLFYAGKLLGRQFFYEKDFRLFSRENFIKVSAWFEKFGYSVILGNRFLSGARSVISLCGGIAGLNTLKVGVYSFISCLVWNVLLVAGGCKVGENWDRIIFMLKRYNTVVLALLVLAVLGFMVKKKVEDFSRKGNN